MANDVMHYIRRNKIPVFNAYPYPAQVIVYVIGEEDALLKAIPDHPIAGDTVNGRCSWMKIDGYNLITIGIRRDLSDFIATVAHECYHAMNCCYTWFGAYHDTENDEPGAYFLAYLVREFSARFGELIEVGK